LVEVVLRDLGDLNALAGFKLVLSCDPQLQIRNMSTCVRHLLVEISVVRTRFASSLSWMWGPAPTPPGFSEE